MASAESDIVPPPLAVLAALDGERHRIRRELHDGVVQLLVSTRYRLEAAAQKTADAVTAEELQCANELLGSALEEIRRITEGLRPVGLDEHCAIEALHQFSIDFGQRTGLKVEFEVKGRRAGRCLSIEVRTALYRIVQEALSNVERHAGASTVVIRVMWTGSLILLSIEDNGVNGRKTGPQPLSGGMGIRNMRDRALMLGGTFTIQPLPTSGMRIEVEIPLRRHTSLEGL